MENSEKKHDYEFWLILYLFVSNIALIALLIFVVMEGGFNAGWVARDNHPNLTEVIKERSKQ